MSEIMSEARKRLISERKKIEKNPQPWFSVDFTDDWEWNVLLSGPPNSPYSEGVFKLTIRFPGDYPYKFPQVRFRTPIFHPNICLGHLSHPVLGGERNEWSPGYTVPKLLDIIRNLMLEPNPNDPHPDAAAEARMMFVTDREAYMRTAEKWTREYARGGAGN